ncbi:PE-PGRS family protein [Nocardia puris]|uniref:McrC family protein n=1 Tax=Nocardia puris TaxID=208602 RepID=UPI00189341F0|nr:PE-PGRS family protein [Nocardia puris]MBF6213050.1 PE-PGRS family protein [Nocardia puris]MBF6368041.1 PE-PGRS family protein [Nocardia puris]MBF6462674.1 PE-PGRS family protein [Nocardia puris]
MTTADHLRVEVAEYETATLSADQLTDTDVRRLTVLQGRRRAVLTETRSGWRFRPEAMAGVLHLDRISLVIAPKMAFSGTALMRWLCYAMHSPVPHEATDRRWLVDRHGFADIVAVALLAECRFLLRDGLRRDYVRTDQVGSVLRGRLDATAQVTQRYGMLDRLHMRTFDREVDIWENRLCGHALYAAGRVVSDPALSREIRVVAREFPRTGSELDALRALDRSRYTGLNLRYRAAHRWSEVWLRGGGVKDLLIDTGLVADSLLLDLPALWEAVVARLCAEAAPEGTTPVALRGEHGIAVRGDLSGRPPFRPDVLLHTNGTSLPIDAKYKSYQKDSVSSADVHQLLTYMAGHADTHAPTAAIVHPSPDRHTYRALRIGGNRRDLGTLHVIGVHGGADPAAAATWIRTTLWARGGTGRVIDGSGAGLRGSGSHDR